MRTPNTVLPMHHVFVEDAYRRIVDERRSSFGEYHKCIFHLHSPASYDYTLIDSMKNRPGEYKSMKPSAFMQIAYDRGLFPKDEIPSLSSVTFPDSLFENSVEYIYYLLIAHELVKNEIELVVLTDHNTVKGYEKLTHAICAYVKSKRSTVYPEVVLGIEISCADRNHIVGIFDHKQEGLFSELNQWIDEHIMSDKDGTYETSVSVLEFIGSIGGIGYIAHIDSSDVFKGEQFSFAFKKKLFNNPNLHAIGLHNMANKESIQGRIQEIADRDFDYVLDCDSHSLDTINTNYMWVKGTKRNFKMIRQAIIDYSFSIQVEKPQRPETFIQGIALKGDKTGFLSGRNGDNLQIRFSEALNCIIGGRGTGKSTILNILGFLLGNRIETEEILEIICTHPFIWVFVYLLN